MKNGWDLNRRDQGGPGGSGWGLGWNPCSRVHGSLQRGVRHTCNPQRSLTVGVHHLDDNPGTIDRYSTPRNKASSNLFPSQ